MTKFVIEGGHPLRGQITPSGNKNEALPAIMATLLTDETITFRRMPKIRDVVSSCQILEELGAEVAWLEDDVLQINTKKIDSYKPNEALCAKIRASILLMGPMLARFGRIELPPPGGDVIGARRLDTHFESLEALGARLKFGHPIVGEIDKIVGTDVYLDEPSVTATENLLLLSVLCEGKTTIHNAASEPHVVGLCNLLNKMGAKIKGLGTNRLEITGVTRLKGAEHTIGPDFMEVGSFLCLGAIAEGQIEILDVELEDLRFVLKMLKKIGINPAIKDRNLTITGGQGIRMTTEISGRVGSIYSGPWPAFPSDLMSVSIVAATQADGTMIFHEKMYEGRMFFTDKLLDMGANIVLCDPHRIVVNGPSKLSAARMSSPDVRAGMAMLIAALVAQGTSTIDNIYQIERGYFNIDKKLEALGAKISKKES